MRSPIKYLLVALLLIPCMLCAFRKNRSFHERSIRISHAYWTLSLSASNPGPNRIFEDILMWDRGEKDQAYVVRNAGGGDELAYLRLDLPARESYTIKETNSLGMYSGRCHYYKGSERVGFEHGPFSLEFKGRFLDVGGYLFAGWPVATKLKRQYLEGFDGTVVLYDRRKTGMKLLAEIDVKYMDLYSVYDKFYLSEDSKYLVFFSTKEHAQNRLFVFRHED